MTRIMWCLVGLLCLTGAVGAMGSANFDLSWNVMGGGGAMPSGAGTMGGTVGQIAGISASPEYQLFAGFWVFDASGSLPKGRLNVSSTPDGAKIFLNDADSGYTTNSSIELDPGEVTVGVAKECYLTPPTVKVIIEKGQTKEIAFALSPDPACNNPIPEYPSLLVPVVTLIAMVSMIFLIRRVGK